MEPRKLISLPKLLRRQRSEARTGPVEDSMEVDPAVSLRLAESAPELGMGPTTSAVPTSGARGSSGMQTIPPG